MTEEEMIGAILFGHEEIKKIVAWIESIQKEIGKEKFVPTLYAPAPEIAAAVKEYADAKMDAVLENCLDQYRALGMTFDEIAGHVTSIADAMQRKADAAAERKVGYHDVD